jgi:hypothetical protein
MGLIILYSNTLFSGISILYLVAKTIMQLANMYKKRKELPNTNTNTIRNPRVKTREDNREVEASKENLDISVQASLRERNMIVDISGARRIAKHNMRPRKI